MFKKFIIILFFVLCSYALVKLDTKFKLDYDFFKTELINEEYAKDRLIVVLKNEKKLMSKRILFKILKNIMLLIYSKLILM